ncbi:hypothetical protein ACFQW6_03570 [Nocardioides sp. GCM10028917]|uniref:hypothetical protein n=1 Tax=Nocardioides sp. GCM10028917 TaxID=3273408 RepID=UPI00361E6E33
MFDLTKDLDRYKGIPPYDSQLYGVYQPLLGWRSKLTSHWLRAGRSLTVDPRVKKILDANIRPSPTRVDAESDWTKVDPLLLGMARPPWVVIVRKDFGPSHLINLVRARLQVFVEEHDGRMPRSQEEWEMVLHADQTILESMPDGSRSLIAQVNDYHHGHFWDAAGKKATERFKADFLGAMQFESQIAELLVACIESRSGLAPELLEELFVVEPTPPLTDLFRPSDPLATIDPREDGGTLAPMGLVHVYRQLYHDLGTFLGEPVEHVWLAPGTTTELIEVSTRREIVERTLEEVLERSTTSERGSKATDELSTAVKDQTESSVNIGISQSNTVDLHVYQGTLNTDVGIASSRANSREQAQKALRETSEKVTSELKQSVKSTFRTTVETTDTSSRRHVIANNTGELVNYELRRKMRRVGVQLQDVGTRMCWQVFVDNPGDSLGLSELVHLTDTAELTNLKEPEKIPPPAPITKQLTIRVPYIPLRRYWRPDVRYEWWKDDNGAQVGKASDPNDNDSNCIVKFDGYKFEPPQTGYELQGVDDIRLLPAPAGQLALLRGGTLRLDRASQKFEFILQQVHYGGQTAIELPVELRFHPTSTEKQRVEDANTAISGAYEEERKLAIRRTLVENVRSRIKDAAGIRPRPSWDLREEERTVIYRQLIKQLMFAHDDAPFADSRERRMAHVRSEILRSIFDIDAMLYFVAPDWWMPRNLSAGLELNPQVAPPHMATSASDTQPAPAAPALDETDTVSYGGKDSRREDNYLITEASQPAKLGSSLGWLLQLDGDNHRNAFLNSPWVKAVIPVQKGRETAALTWLRAVENQPDDGWDHPYSGTDPEFVGKTLGKVLETIANRLTADNGSIDQTLATDKVFSEGFDPMGESFDAAVEPHKPFSQWISVIPTDQIVAVEYKPMDLQKDDE